MTNPAPMAALIGDTKSVDFSSVLNSIDYAVTIWSIDDALVYVNQAGRAFFQSAGIDAADGLQIDEFLKRFAESGLPLIAGRQVDWLEQERSAFAEATQSLYSLVDGRVLAGDRWRLPDGSRLMMLRDVTADRRNERALQKAKQEAERADKTKSRFLRAANHDLRQPLATLKILIYNCMQTDDPEHRDDLLHAMDISVSIMEDLLGALLNIGQLDAGQITPRVTTFQLSSLLDRLSIEFSHQAKEKGLDFRVVQCRYTVVSDRALLERIVSNLVANAIRYTARGGVLVGCRRHGDGVRLEVRDSGVGIAEENLAAIFEEFFQIDRSRKRRGSLGLGLNISKRLATILGHDLEVSSRLGEGSLFTIDLPLGNIMHSDIGDPEITEKIGGEFTGLKVLVLEDDEILRGALVELLERWGILIAAFNAQQDFAAKLREIDFHPDLIISDFRLHGGLKGNDVVQDVRRQLGGDIPAIVVTADTEPSVIAGIRSEGLPVLIKPVSPPRLRVMMHNILYEPELVRELANAKDPPSFEMAADR